MRLVQAHASNFMVVAIQDGDLMRLLQDLHSKIAKNER
jgi:hypothetical protein